MKLHGFLALVAREADGWSCGLFRLDADPNVAPIKGLVFASVDPRTELQAQRALVKRAGKGEPILWRYRYAGGQVKLPPIPLDLPMQAGPVWTTVTTGDLPPGKGRALYRLLDVAASQARAALAGQTVAP